MLFNLQEVVMIEKASKIFHSNLKKSMNFCSRYKSNFMTFMSYKLKDSRILQEIGVFYWHFLYSMNNLRFFAPLNKFLVDLASRSRDELGHCKSFCLMPNTRLSVLLLMYGTNHSMFVRTFIILLFWWHRCGWVSITP